jgi:hypothetical protein
MAIVTRAIDRMLQQHEPHPALVLDRYWNVIRTNKAAPQFFGSFVDLEARPKPRNLLDLMFDPAGMLLRPRIHSGGSIANHCASSCAFTLSSGSLKSFAMAERARGDNWSSMKAR